MAHLPIISVRAAYVAGIDLKLRVSDSSGGLQLNLSYLASTWALPLPLQATRRAVCRHLLVPMRKHLTGIAVRGSMARNKCLVIPVQPLAIHLILLSSDNADG